MSVAMDCDWIQIKDRIYQCRRCGKVIGVPVGKQPNWEAMPECPGPTAAQKVWSYAAAVSRWITAGRPERNHEEVQQLLAICQKCHFFADNTCRKCGCRLAGRNALVSKLKMATEHCPIGRW